jgi:hypothetical protein
MKMNTKRKTKKEMVGYDLELCEGCYTNRVGDVENQEE